MRSQFALAIAFLCLLQWSTPAVHSKKDLDLRVLDALKSPQDLPGTDDAIRERFGRIMVPCNEKFCCPKIYHSCCESGQRCCDFLGRRSMPSKCA